MSWTTVTTDVLSIDDKQLLNLFLGKGNLKVSLPDQTVVINEISDTHILRVEEENIPVYTGKIYGYSDKKDILFVNGSCVIKPSNLENEAFTITLQMELNDNYD